MNQAEKDYSGLILQELNYNSYLRVPELLGLQRVVSDPPHHDEMFFIVIHQSFELWFKEALHETDLLVQHLRSGSASKSLKVIKRINAIFQCLAQQIQLLHTLTPVEFAGFRDKLFPASGFQSVQFREVEFAYGLRDRFFLKFFEGNDFAMERLLKRLGEPSVYDEFLACLHRWGIPVPEAVLARDVEKPYEIDPELVNVLRDVYLKPEDDFHLVLLFEALLDFDTLFSQWRATHVLMVSRTIGGQVGTGGSSGREFLESRLPYRFFPELWEVRNAIWQEMGGKP
ncbi:MAG: tryptophan 2,3-dioxygenase [Planctomycetota bacterium]|nr:MAG: tryptophan 2,3-dioxygenase [Planctomycetota bacterium]